MSLRSMISLLEHKIDTNLGGIVLGKDDAQTLVSLLRDVGTNNSSQCVYADRIKRVSLRRQSLDWVIIQEWYTTI